MATNYMNPDDPTGGVFGALTDWVPVDLGISEALGGAKGSLEYKPSPLNPNYPTDRSYSPEAYSTPSTSSSVSGIRVAPPKDDGGDVLVADNTRNLPNANGGSGSGGYSAGDLAGSIGMSKDEARGRYPGMTMPEIVAQYRRDAQENAARQRKQAQQIGGAWDPVITELDRQIGRLPGRQQEYSEQLGGLATQQLEQVGLQETQSTEALETERGRGLRNLEEDIRNQMTAAGRLIGGIGGGSSSAVQQASEAVTRSGQKVRGSLMETVVSKISEIKNIANQERNKIGQWKSTKLFEIVQFFSEKLDELSTSKAGAKGDRAKAIEELKFDVERDLSNRLSQLDDTVINYAGTLDQWERERTAELQDMAAKQGRTTAAGGADIGKAISTFNDLVDMGYTQEQAQEWMEAQGLWNLPDEEPEVAGGDFERAFGTYQSSTPYTEMFGTSSPSGDATYDPFSGLGL